MKYHQQPHHDQERDVPDVAGEDRAASLRVPPSAIILPEGLHMRLPQLHRLTPQHCRLYGENDAHENVKLE